MKMTVCFHFDGQMLGEGAAKAFPVILKDYYLQCNVFFFFLRVQLLRWRLLTGMFLLFFSCPSTSTPFSISLRTGIPPLQR